jgi:hypothetical protein
LVSNPYYSIEIPTRWPSFFYYFRLEKATYVF